MVLNRGFMDSTAASANPCSAGTAAPALPKSRLLRAGPLRADNGTKRLCPSPTPQGGACVPGLPLSRRTFPGCGCGRSRDYKITAFLGGRGGGESLPEVCDREGEGAFRPNLEEVRE